MAANVYTGPERRGKKPAPIDPTKRTVLPANYYIDSWLVPPMQVKPPVLTTVVERAPMEPTRIDIWLPEPKEEIALDFEIPAEQPLWVLWCLAQQEREAMDCMSVDAFSETIVMQGARAETKLINIASKRVMESQNRLFRFAVDHDVDAVDPALPVEPQPVRVIAVDTRADSIRTAAAFARKADLRHMAKMAQPERQRISWPFAAGLLVAVALFFCFKVLKL
jgi:hypothetical protein